MSKNFNFFHKFSASERTKKIYAFDSSCQLVCMQGAGVFGCLQGQKAFNGSDAKLN